MNSITTKAMAKVAVVATGLAMATSMLSLASVAHAACSVGAVNLTVGSTGAAVTCLQQSLIAAGYSIPAGATGYFGSQTMAAVAAWQAAVGVAPAAGYFGPISRAAWNLSSGGGSTSTVPGCAPGAMFSSTTGQACTSTTTVPGCAPGALFSSTTGQACGGTTTTTGPLAGTDGSISAFTELGSYDSEEVSEGDSGVKVLGADVEASNDGDISLSSVRVSFDPTGNTGSDDLDDYLESVSVWLGSTKVGEADVSDFTQDSNDLWVRTISLNNAVVRADQIAKLYIAVDAVGNIDSGDISGDSWTVDIENVRFLDGSGVTTTETGYDIDGMNVPIAFVSFASSADTELKVTTDSDSPEAGIVIVDDSDTTNDVVLLKGSLELEGTSDGVIDEFPVTFTATTGGTANGVDDIAGSVTLVIGGEEFTETMTLTSALTGTITFDNLDFSIDAGDTVDFEVRADVQDLDGTIFAAGDTLLASVTSTNRDYMDVENSQGDQLADSGEKSGTATGEAQEFRVNGIMLTFVSASTDITSGTSANDDLGTFVLRYKVTAVGDTVYVSTLADVQLSGNTVGKTTVLPDRAGTATVATNGASVTVTNLTDTDLNAAGLYEIEEGSSHTFEVTTTLQLPHAGTAGQYRVVLGGVRWDTDSTDPTPDNSYTSNLDNFKTVYLGLN